MTRRFSHTEIVTLAVYMLGGKDRFIDTEDVAVKAHELAPGRFSWTKYPELINLEGVRVRRKRHAEAALTAPDYFSS